MTTTKATSPGRHFVIVSAEADRALALALWRALRRRAVSVGFNEATVEAGEADGLIVLNSPALHEDLQASARIRAFLDIAPREHVLLVPLQHHTTPPPVLQAERGQGGFLQPVPAPAATPSLDPAGVETVADAVETFAAKGAEHEDRPIAQFARRLREPLTAALCLAVVGLGAVSAVSLWQTERFAGKARDADRFSGTLLSELARQLPDAARHDVLIAIADGALANLGDEPLSALDDGAIARRAGLMHYIGEARDVHGDPQGALEAFRLAHDLTGTLLARAPENPERIFDHSQSAFWLANSAYRQGDLETARPAYERYHTLTGQLVRLDPDDPLYKAERAHATVNLGVVALEEADAGTASQLFQEAMGLFNAGPLQAGTASPVDIANTLGWQAEAYAQAGALEAAAEARAREAELYRARLEDRPDDAATLVRHLHARQEQAALLAALGETGRAGDILEAQIDTAAALNAEMETNARLRRLYSALLHDRARLALWNDDLIRAQLLLGEAERLRLVQDEAGADDARHSERIYYHLLAAEIALAAGAAESAVLEASKAVLAGEQAMAAGFESARPLAARAYFLHGEALDAAGAPVDARSAWRTARNHLGDGDGARSPLERDLLARIAWRLGEREAAQSLRASGPQLARPDIIAFWREASGSSTAQNQATGRQNDDG